jgi:hypothetical protein
VRLFVRTIAGGAVKERRDEVSISVYNIRRQPAVPRPSLAIERHFSDDYGQ